MKPALVITLIILAIIAPMTFLKDREVYRLKESVAEQEAVLNAERARNDGITAKLDESWKEMERLKEGNTELIRLRGEVNALKRERDELQKKVGGLETAAARAKEREEKTAAAQQQAQEVQLQQAANSTSLGAQGGFLRRKILSGQPLTPEEQQTVVNLQQRVSELEKTPTEFAQYQAAYVASALGWNNDPRSQQLQDLLTKVSQAANNRGLTFNAPGQTYETWNDAQKALDNRATGAVKGMLSAEEAAVFDKTLTSVLSANPAAAPRVQ